MTTRIDTRFAELKKEGRAAFVTFVMCGDPDLATSSTSQGAAKAGATSSSSACRSPIDGGRPGDPGRGPRAQGRHHVKKTLQVVRDFRKENDRTPLVLMGYYNPIYVYGVDRF